MLKLYEVHHTGKYYNAVTIIFAENEEEVEKKVQSTMRDECINSGNIYSIVEKEIKKGTVYYNNGDY